MFCFPAWMWRQDLNDCETAPYLARLDALMIKAPGLRRIERFAGDGAGI